MVLSFIISRVVEVYVAMGNIATNRLSCGCWYTGRGRQLATEHTIDFVRQDEFTARGMRTLFWTL